MLRTTIKIHFQASMAKLLYKILDSDATKLKLNKRSAAVKMLGSIN